jgi:hypothetical protein
MKLNYVPLLQIQRGIQGMPLGMDRFRHYVRTIFSCYDRDFPLIPLLIANPMGKDHVTALLDELLSLGADQLGAQAAALASEELSSVPGEFKAAIVVADDLLGGGTNRYDYEFTVRFGPPKMDNRRELLRRMETNPSKWLRFLWVTGVLWSSEPASARTVREAILTAAYRFGYQHEHGAARTLREMMAQEGQVMAMADCAGPALDDDDIAYTREILTPFLDATDMRTCIECLFGDAAALTLGFTPRGLSHWAGLALALHDARSEVLAVN